jgi:CubicO group peptidase (beta-lactamase class C family)
MFSPGSSKLQGKTCMGFNMNIQNRRLLNPMRTMLTILREVVRQFPDSSRNKEIDRTARSVGSRKLLTMVKSGKSIDEIERTFRKEADDFAEKTKKYHLYTPETLTTVITKTSLSATSADYEALPPYERLQSAVKTVVDAAIQDGTFPSASVGIVHNGKVVMRESFGRFTYAPNSLKTPLDAVYDMASLTKVMATTLCLMKLYDEGTIALDDSVTKYIPEFGANGKSHIRIKNLLLHNSGLAAFRQYDLRVQGAEEALKALYAEKLVYKTGDSTVYSDLGFITLGEIIRRISSKPLDVFYAENIARPLGLQSSVFNPDSVMRLRTAPTENDTTWKQDFKRPLVHDPRSALLHGVAGHAGLFSNVDDVLRVMQVLTAPEANLVGGKPFIKPETVKLFTTRASEKSSRALGWDTKLPEKCSCGDFFSPSSFGHTGFTGTSIWYDPVRKLCVVLLSNRVFPTSENNKIRAVRPAIHNAVVQALESR